MIIDVKNATSSKKYTKSTWSSLMIKLSILTVIIVDLHHNKLSKSFSDADLNLLIAQNEIEFLEFYSFLNRDDWNEKIEGNLQ